MVGNVLQQIYNTTVNIDKRVPFSFVYIKGLLLHLLNCYDPPRMYSTNDKNKSPKTHYTLNVFQIMSEPFEPLEGVKYA